MKYNVKWVMEIDPNFYDMYAVRPKNDKDFNSPRLFHFIKEEDAKKFKGLLEKSHCSIPNPNK